MCVYIVYYKYVFEIFFIQSHFYNVYIFFFLLSLNSIESNSIVCLYIYFVSMSGFLKIKHLF